MTEPWEDGRDMALREQEDRKATLRAEIERLEAHIREADARLAEAAALEPADHADFCEGCDRCRVHDHIDEARAAIAKAKGEQS